MKAIKITNLYKSFNNKLQALKNINLNINKGEIFALLGPNGAGKSTLINIICGITNKTSGQVSIFGKDIITDYKRTREMIGLVPQEIATDSFEKVINTLKFSRGLFNKSSSLEYLESTLKSLDLYSRRNSQIRTLSGGMKRRLMIAKALCHEPKILFLDEPTAGVDVNLRKSLWKYLNNLKNSGVTIFLTTHYIEEAENIADRVAVIDNGKIKIVEKKENLLKKFGNKHIIITIKKSVVPNKILKKYQVILENKKLIMAYNTNVQKLNASNLMSELSENSINFKEIEITKSNLEKIFLNLLEK